MAPVSRRRLFHRAAGRGEIKNDVLFSRKLFMHYEWAHKRFVDD